jgi:hypothetical protein
VPAGDFEVELSGGHPNSLGNTEAVAERVRRDPELLDELIDTYSSDDEVVRLRVSSVLKRLVLSHPEWVLPRLHLIEQWVDRLQQPSAQWSLSQDYLALTDALSPHQCRAAIGRMKGFLGSSNDWIVINHTLETLGQWARKDPELRDWLLPRLHDYSHETRKSIAGKARRHLAVLDR